MITRTRFALSAAAGSALLLLACADSASTDVSGLGVGGTPAVPAAGSGVPVVPAAGGGSTPPPGAGRTAVSTPPVAGTGSTGIAGAPVPPRPQDDSDAGVPPAAGSGAPAAGSGAAGVGAAGGTAPAPQGEDGILSRPAFKPTGMPIMAPDKTWTYVPFMDTQCRSGSPAGISVNLSAGSKRVMIYLEGGGACFDSQTCGANPDSVGSQNPSGNGVFDRNRAENPVKDWSFVYVPYCTGDVHMGAKDSQIPGLPGTQHFAGRKNLKAFLERVVPTFADAQQVLLTGVSAGGFGAASNAAYVQWAFGAVPVTMVDDSGPTFSSEFLPKCLTDKYVQYWGLENSILDDCGKSCDASMDYSTQFLEYTAGHATGKSSGLIEADADSIIRGFYGIGTNNGADDCNGILLFTPMPAADFLMGLLDYRERVKKFPNFSTYYPSGSQHTWLGGEGFYTSRIGDVSLVDWFRGVIEGKPAVHAGH